MKRKVNQQRHQYRWKRKLFAAVFMGFVVCLMLMETRYSQIMGLGSVHHRSAPRPKIAFLFIARNRLPLDMVWHAFFQVSSNFSRSSTSQKLKLLIIIKKKKEIAYYLGLFFNLCPRVTVISLSCLTSKFHFFEINLTVPDPENAINGRIGFSSFELWRVLSLVDINKCLTSIF